MEQAAIAAVKQEVCTAQLRWVPKSSMGLETKLQQLWQCTLFEGGVATEQRGEWRDVPFDPAGR